MKPPDQPWATLLLLPLLLLLLSCFTAGQVPSAPSPSPPPPLLNIHVPGLPKAWAGASGRLQHGEVSSVKSSVAVQEPGRLPKQPKPIVPDAVVVNEAVARAKSPPVVQVVAQLDKAAPDVEGDNDDDEVVTKSSVEGSIAEIGPRNEDDTVVEGSPVEGVTRTSLKVSGVELGENGEVVSLMPEENLQDAVTQTSIRFTQQELHEEDRPKPASNETQLTAHAKSDVENIQEILKQIQNEVGEARILYVADPKAKKGVRIAHQPTEPPTEVPPPEPEYNDEEYDYPDEDRPLVTTTTTTPVPVVKLKKLSLPKERPSIIRVRTKPARTRGGEPEGNAIGAAIKTKAPKQTRPAFGILSRPKKPTVAPGPRTVRPFVKVFDRARERPKTKTIQQVRIRKPGMRITTVKPVRKGFPIGPPKSAGLPIPSAPSGPSLADFEELYRRQKGQSKPYETSTYRTVEEDVPDDFGEPDSQVPLVYYEGQTRITDGWEWSPYLDDRNTKEFKYLAFHVKEQLKSFLDETRYGEFLNYILIDGFSKGVDVDFFLVFYQTEPMIDDHELTEDVRDVMAYKSENDFEFVLDPNATSFKFKYVKSPASERLVELPWLPNWAIAMLVFGFGSLVLIAGSLIMANNFRSNRRLNDIKKKKLQEKELQLQMMNMPHRYPEATKEASNKAATAINSEKKPKPQDTKSSNSGNSSRSYAVSIGTLDKRPPMLDRYQRDYGAYEQKIPPSDSLFSEFDDRRKRVEPPRYSNYNKAVHRIGENSVDPDPTALGGGYSTVGSHFPSSFKTLLKPSRSILYRAPR